MSKKIKTNELPDFDLAEHLKNEKDIADVVGHQHHAAAFGQSGNQNIILSLPAPPS